MTTSIVKATENNIKVLDTQIEAIRSQVPARELSIFQASREMIAAKIPREHCEGLYEAVIEQIAQDCGIRWNQDEMEDRARSSFEFFYEFYSNITLQELKLAFKLLMSGELDDFLPRNKFGEPDRALYNTINNEILGRILNAFRRKKAHASSVVRKAIYQLPAPEITDERKRELELQAARRYYDLFEKYKTERNITAWVFAFKPLFDYLQKVGIQVASLDVSDKDLTKARTLVMIDKTRNSYDKMYISSIGEAYKTHPIVVSEAEYLRKQNALKETFDMMIKKRINLKKLIEKHEGITL